MIHAPIAADYLTTFLAPLQPWLMLRDTTDLYVNRAGEVWVERTGGRVACHKAPKLTEDWLWQLSQQMARVSHQGISRAEPLLSASLPCGTRVQVVAPPATRSGFAMAFRRQVTTGASLADLHARSMFDDLSAPSVNGDVELRRLHAAGDPLAFLAAAVVRRKTILVSGGTASGKTTLVNALLREIPAHERLIAIEDSAELTLDRANAVGLIAVRGRMGESTVEPEDLLQASLRLRPDRILIGEVRGREALTFLRAINTGHPGSMTTIHANSPDEAIEHLAMLARQSGANYGADELHAYIRRSIDIIVQMHRSPHGPRVSTLRWLAEKTSPQR